MRRHDDQIKERVMIKRSLDRYPVAEELIGRTAIRSTWRSGPDRHTTHWLLKPDQSETSIPAEIEDLWVWGKSLSPITPRSNEASPRHGIVGISRQTSETLSKDIKTQAHRQHADLRSAQSQSAKRENVSYKLQYKIWRRDAWHCRYCLNPLFFAPTLKELDHRAPGRGIYHPHGKLSVMLPFLALAWASVDHYLPVSCGGANDEENLMSACWGCNSEFGAIAPDSKDIQEIPQGVRSLNWDGLSGLYLSLVLKPDRWTRLIEGSSSRGSGNA